MSLLDRLYRRSASARRQSERIDSLKDQRASLKASLHEARQSIRSLTARTGYPPEPDPTHTGEMSAALAALLASDPVTRAIPGIDSIAPRVRVAVAPRDIMLVKSSAQHYLATGFSALDSILRCLPELKDLPYPRILDFGCGYGRVLRILRATWPLAPITAADLEPDGLAFCMEHFDISGFRSQISPVAIPLAHSFDLIWVGSLVTHLDAPKISGFLNLFSSLLAPGGHVVFTSHGDHMIDRLQSGTCHYDLTPEKSASLLSSYASSGFGYEDYPNRSGYGVSATSESWMRHTIAAIPSLRFRAWLPHHWDNHQDVWCCSRQ